MSTTTPQFWPHLVGQWTSSPYNFGGIVTFRTNAASVLYYLLNDLLMLYVNTVITISIEEGGTYVFIGEQYILKRIVEPCIFPDLFHTRSHI